VGFDAFYVVVDAGSAGSIERHLREGCESYFWNGRGKNEERMEYQWEL